MRKCPVSVDSPSVQSGLPRFVLNNEVYWLVSAIQTRFAPHSYTVNTLPRVLLYSQSSRLLLAEITLIMKLVHLAKHKMSNIWNKCVCWRLWLCPVWHPGLFHTRLWKNGKGKAATVTNSACGWAESVTHNALLGNSCGLAVEEFLMAKCNSIKKKNFLKGWKRTSLGLVGSQEKLWNRFF